eukprot:14431193-Alexandrium_andersonii.AAC.1
MGPRFTWSKHSQFRTMSAASVPGGTRSSTSTSYECPTCWVEATAKTAAAWLGHRTWRTAATSSSAPR